MARQKSSSIWKRTIYYFCFILVLFSIAVIYFLYQVSQDRVVRNLWTGVKQQRAVEIEARLADLQAAGETGPGLTAWRTENMQDLQDATELKQLEKTPRTSNNSKRAVARMQALWQALVGAESGRNATLQILEEEIYNLHIKVIIVFAIFTAGVAGIMFVLVRMILLPLEKIIVGARAVARGHLETKFSIRSTDELGELAAVMTDLTANTGELLRLMKSSYENGQAQLDALEAALQSGSAEDREKAKKEVRVVFNRLQEITEYFSYKQG